MIRGAAFLLLAALAFPFHADARPRVCVVLSGGGARGAAHVGVLKVLEELRVPVDCIAGTSMGSIVGGAYATGLPLAEMEHRLGDIDSALLFVEKPPRTELTMRRKQDDRSILFGLELGLRDGEVKLPKGIVTGVQLEGVLRSLVRAPGARDFDKLPIPFRAVATDLETGTAVVISQGEVAQAMRASMSVPGVIAPAERDGHVLVDGGLTNNLPVDVARAMGAEVVIAVNLGTPLLKREKLGSAVGVTSQMINILTEQNVRASLASLRADDVLIEPELGNFSAADFDALARAVPIGEAAARKAAGRLMQLAVTQAEYDHWRVGREREGTETVVIDEIRFAPLERVNVEVPRATLATVAGEPLEAKVVDADMRRLYGSGDFERVGYSVLEEKGRHVLAVDAVEKSWGPDYLRLGLAFGTDFAGDAFFNAAASYRRTWINSLGGEWRLDGQLGNSSRIFTELYQPLFVNRALFVAPRLEAERRIQDAYSGTQRVARFDVRSRLAGIDLGSEFGRFAELRLGAVTGSVQAREETGPPELDPGQSRVAQGAWTGRLVFDQLDSVNFPRHGFAGRLSVYDATPDLGSDVRYTRWDGNALAAISSGRHTLQLAARGGAPSGGHKLPAYDQFVWGGFLEQSGLPHGSVTGQRFAFGRAVYYYRLQKQRLFEGAYAGVSLEAGHYSEPLTPKGLAGDIRSAAAFVAIDTPIGPLYLGYGRATGGNSAVYVYLGRP